MLMEALLGGLPLWDSSDWAARFLAEGHLESSVCPGDRQRKPGKHEERTCDELAPCLAGGALAGSHIR